MKNCPKFKVLLDKTAVDLGVPEDQVRKVYLALRELKREAKHNVRANCSEQTAQPAVSRREIVQSRIGIFSQPENVVIGLYFLILNYDFKRSHVPVVQANWKHARDAFLQYSKEGKLPIAEQAVQQVKEAPLVKQREKLRHPSC